MNQVYSGNYQSYQPSYYQAPPRGQWTAPGYNQGSNSYYSHGKAVSPHNYAQNTYSTPCIGQCNPPKLYADTFSYLTENLMKPVIEEVYQDLKSITAANTIPNNPAASKIGLQAQGKPIIGQETGQNPLGQKIVANQPLSPGLIQGQLHNVSAVRPTTQAQSGIMPQTSLSSQMRTPYQQNAAIRRNGFEL